jgi:hypothetical protein
MIPTVNTESTGNTQTLLPTSTTNVQTLSTPVRDAERTSSTSAAGSQSNDETMVLEEHHRSNGAPRPPNANHLMEIRHSLPPIVSSKTRAKRHSKTPYVRTNSKSTHLRFYPPKWRDVLEIARWNFRLSLATKAPFPDRASGRTIAKDCLTQAGLEHERHGNQVEAGRFPNQFWSSMFTNPHCRL